MLHRVLFLFGAALAVAASAASQAVVHRIPERGALLYDREFQRETAVLAPPTGINNQHVGEVPDNPGAAVVLHSDLDRKSRGIERRPTGLLEIATHAAFDLSTLGKKAVEFEVDEIRPFGALHVDGVITPDADGAERLVLTIRPVEREKREPEPECVLEATMRVVRKFDPDRGVVARIETVFSGELRFTQRKNEDQIQRARFTVRDVWQLREVVPNRGPQFNGRVADAIRKGATDLKKILEGDLAQKYRAEPDPGGQTRPSGELALLLLTLLKAGEPPNDPIIARGLADLRRRHITDTYSLGVALLAIEACYTPPGEREELLSGRATAPFPRVPTAEDKQLIEGWVAQLLQNRTDAGRDNTTRWHYLGGPGFDNSCSQYAVLGLYAADLCGVSVDRDIWVGAARHFLQVQCPAKAKVRISLTTHEQAAKNKSGGGTSAATDAAGWAYTDKNGQPTGSMTTAGVGSLTICDVMLHGKRRPVDVSGAALRAAIRSGFAWLAANYDVRRNPGAEQSWRLYYLYGLERVCELNQIAHIEDKDWYFDGATLLLEQQGANGRWGDEIETCFALLFLKKAALPAITGGR